MSPSSLKLDLFFLTLTLDSDGNRTDRKVELTFFGFFALLLLFMSGAALFCTQVLGMTGEGAAAALIVLTVASFFIKLVWDD